MNPGGTPIFKGKLCKDLTTPFFCSLLAQLFLKQFALSPPQDPMCFEFWIKSYNFVTQ